MDQAGLRDHAKGMLLEIADDLDTHQNESEQAAKSKGDEAGDGQESSADKHGGDRQTSGFSVMDTISEFRALRASVVSHWTKAYPTVIGQQLEDLTRFHEAIDQALAESLEHYATVKEMETRLFGAILVASPDPICVLDLEGRFSPSLCYKTTKYCNNMMLSALCVPLWHYFFCFVSYCRLYGLAGMTLYPQS